MHDFDPDLEEKWHDEQVARARSRTRWTAADLIATEFPEPRWAVPGILPEGLTMLCGAPKVGKSWAALGLAAAVATGGSAFGAIPVEEGDVLYLALEDHARRLQTRLQTVFGEEAAPHRLHIWTECERMPEGGTEIRHWLDSHPDARMVAVDVFTKMRPPADGRTSAYEGDYIAAGSLKAIADDYGVCVLVVHHVRKAGSEDFVDGVSGTHGIAGAADGILILSKPRGSADGQLELTGRDIPETTKALAWSADLGAWTLLDGPVEEHVLAPTRAQIHRVLREGGPMTPKGIAGALDLNPASVRQTLRRMDDDQQVDSDGGGTYFLPLSPVTAVTVTHLEV